MIDDRARGRWLWLLFSLFVLRVTGQIIVYLLHPAWLPPWDEWQSGLLPYPVLLAAQTGIIVLMALLCRDNSGTAGRFTIQRDPVRRRLRIVAAIYASAMVLRYVLTQTLTMAAWSHDVIPVVFHLVLASYIAILGKSIRTRN